MNTHSLGKISLWLGAGLFSTTIAQAQLPDGLLNYWPLDGNATDVAATTAGTGSTTADDGTVNGAVTFVDNTDLGAGFGMAGNFPGGAGNNITVADPDGGTNDIDRSGADLSISLWFKLANRDNNWQALIAHGEGTDYRVAIRGGEDPIQYSYAGGGASSDIFSATTYGAAPAGDGVWHHLVAITEGSTTSLYMDGVLEASGGTGPINENGQNLLCIGCNPTNGREWNGLIDDIGMWGRALTAEEVKLIYDTGVAGNDLSTLIVSGDSDGDGLPDAWELLYDLDPNDDGSIDINNGADGDPDMDNVSNIDEFNNGTLPNNDDSDGDTLTDGIETNTGTFSDANDTGTDPLNKDSDGDGLEDNVEDAGGTFVNDTMTGSNPTEMDSDGDTMPDGYEVTNMQDPTTNDGALDPDADNLSNLEEFGLGTNPRDKDTDDDSSDDDVEGTNGTDPLDDDTDDDTLLDGYETNNGANSYVSPTDTGTDPLAPDSDGDGTHDGAEVQGLRDPTNPGDAVTAGPGRKLVAYWNFDNNLDDAAHTLPGESMIADTGTFTGPGTDVFYAAEGLFGSSALEQNGAAGWVTVPSSVDTLRGLDNSVSVSTWVKVTSLDVNWQAIISHGEGRQWRFARNAEEPGVAWSGGNADIVGGDVSDGQWHHVVGISDPVNAISSLYVDGVLVTTGEAPAITDVNGGIIPDLYIGANPQGGNREWNGQIDDLGIWGRALTEEEVLEIYNNGDGISIEEFIGGGTVLAITDINYDANGGNPRIDLTWNSRGNVSYGIYYSTDLLDWSGVVRENINGEQDSTTATFPLPVAGAEKLFFRVEPTRPPAG